MAVSGWTKEDIYLVAERAHSLHLQGRYREARIIFEGLVAIDPSDRYCCLALAASYMALGEAERSVQQLTKLLSRHPNDTEARARRCEAYLQLNRVQEAREDWDLLKQRLAVPYVRRLQLRVQTKLIQA